MTGIPPIDNTTEIDDTEHKQWVVRQHVKKAAGVDLNGFVRTFRGTQHADHYLDRALRNHSSFAMELKLEHKREQGRGGWWDADQCTINDLRELLRDHVEKGDMVDVMNIAAMIYAREAMAQAAAL